MNWKKSPAAVLAVLMAIHLLAFIDRNVLLAFSPQITHDLGLSNSQYGFLVGAGWVTSYSVMVLVMGMLADRFSRPRLIAVGILIWSASTAASGMAHTFDQMIVARFFVASGEAALIPAALALLFELFPPQRRSAAMGLFFMAIPAGFGCAYLIAGTFGTAYGWRSTFLTLGGIGAVIALLLSLLNEHRDKPGQAVRGEPLVAQTRAAVSLLRSEPALVLTILGFVLVHMAFVGMSFAQLWLVRERGVDGSSVARTMGTLQIVFGALGSFAGGALSDRYARRLPGGRATVMTLMVLLAAPLMIAYRLAAPGSPLFYLGMCAGFFLPLAMYGPANTIIQGRTPPHMRATMTACTMVFINLFAHAIGNLAVGRASDAMRHAGMSAPLTHALLGTDIVVLASALFFFMVARQIRGTSKIGAVNVPG